MHVRYFHLFLSAHFRYIRDPAATDWSCKRVRCRRNLHRLWYCGMSQRKTNVPKQNNKRLADIAHLTGRTGRYHEPQLMHGVPAHGKLPIPTTAFYFSKKNFECASIAKVMQLWLYHLHFTNAIAGAWQSCQPTELAWEGVHGIPTTPRSRPL